MFSVFECEINTCGSTTVNNRTARRSLSSKARPDGEQHHDDAPEELNEEKKKSSSRGHAVNWRDTVNWRAEACLGKRKDVAHVDSASRSWEFVRTLSERSPQRVASAPRNSLS